MQNDAKSGICFKIILREGWVRIWIEQNWPCGLVIFEDGWWIHERLLYYSALHLGDIFYNKNPLMVIFRTPSVGQTVSVFRCLDTILLGLHPGKWLSPVPNCNRKPQWDAFHAQLGGAPCISHPSLPLYTFWYLSSQDAFHKQWHLNAGWNIVHDKCRIMGGCRFLATHPMEGGI